MNIHETSFLTMLQKLADTPWLVERRKQGRYVLLETSAPIPHILITYRHEIGLSDADLLQRVVREYCLATAAMAHLDALQSFASTRPESKVLLLHLRGLVFTCFQQKKKGRR